ncbi:hypothetical protein AAG570_002136 [Ranatra chinensis]|uniref:G-protein coupled receptors family 1 profile domain-containing protein n=1 Tax=Ranatra chinensis TaxID=642074 RepID=A0ABD0Y6M1_9HEMI
MLWGSKRDPLYVVLPITLAYVAIFVSGVVGNVSTCIVIARNRHMHTATNYYLFSLAISDLLLLVAGMPPEMYHIWSNYPYVFGETFCILTGFASETSTNATLLTITAFTVERYVAICHPFFSHTLSKLSRAVKLIVLIWLLALSLAIPQVIQVGLVYAVDAKGEVISEEYKMCGLKKMVIPYSFEVSTLLFFLAPMTVIVVLYILIALRLRRSTVVNQRQRPHHRDSRRSTTGNPTSTKRVVKMLVAVVVAFFICWAPFHFQRLYSIYAFEGDNTSSGNLMIYKIITYISGLLYYLSTTVNPFLYNIMSLKFREAFKSTLAKCIGGSKKQRTELGGSSGGGGGGGSLCPGRFNYSVLSHRLAIFHN